MQVNRRQWQLAAFSVVVTLFFVAVGANSANKERLIVIGKVPGQYLPDANDSKTHLRAITIEGRIITNIQRLSDMDDDDATREEQIKALRKSGAKVIVAKSGGTYDILYPGLIDLHGHNKQNVLPTWGYAKESADMAIGAKGQFANRHEWRRVNEYKKVQGDNMNPWSSNKGALIATYRWSELQAMVLGTAYLQGASQNHKGFGIHSVEDADAFLSKRTGISSPGDLLEMKNPVKIAFIWNELRPVIEGLGCLGDDGCYGTAVAKYLETACPEVPKSVLADIYADENYEWISSNISAKAERPVFAKSGLCPNVPEEKQEMFLKYFDGTTFGGDQHGQFIKKYAALKRPDRSAIITHLAEGRRLDPQNWSEFQILKLAGLDIPGMAFIHGVGLTESDFKHMAKRGMGLVWSPYSNFLLYGQTIDIEAAFKAGVTIALGSDWTPTGSKGVLDELKLARRYLQKIGLYPNLIDDRELYKMVTENPAKIMNHFGFEGPDEHGIGTIEVGAMGTLIAIRSVASDPYENIVEHAAAPDVNLMVIDGVPVYGNQSYIREYDASASYDIVSGKIFAAELEKDPHLFPYKDGKNAASDEAILEKAKLIELAESDACGFSEPKVLVYQGESYDFDGSGKVKDLLDATGMNLDRFDAIHKYLGVALLSQGHNITFSADELRVGDQAVRQFPPLYGCDDVVYSERLRGMVSPNGDDELDRNAAERWNRRMRQGLFSVPAKGDFSYPHELALLLELPLQLHLISSSLADVDSEVVVEVELAQ